MKAKGFTHDSVANKTVDWYTPEWLFKEMNTTFTLDPCSPEGGVPWIPAVMHYSLKDDGLTAQWFGKVWLNPPYGTHTSAWLSRMHEHRNGIALVFSRTDTQWFHDYVRYADAILFVKSRINFVDGLGKTGSSGSGCGSLLAAWGDENVATLERIKHLGMLIKTNG